MKKVLVPILTLVVLLILISMPLQAQTSMSFGPKAGGVLANLTGSDVPDEFSWKFGFTGGAFLAIDVSPTLTIQPELLYVMKGTKGDSADFTLKIKGDYIEIPVLVKWKAPTQGSVKPNLFAGIAPAFLMSAKVSGDSAGVDLGEVDIKDETKSFDFGITFGGGLDFPAGSGTVCFDVRYTLGLTSIDDTGFDENIKNSAISATIGYAIPIGAKP